MTSHGTKKGTASSLDLLLGAVGLWAWPLLMPRWALTQRCFLTLQWGADGASTKTEEPALLLGPSLLNWVIPAQAQIMGTVDGERPVFQQAAVCVAAAVSEDWPSFLISGLYTSLSLNRPQHHSVFSASLGLGSIAEVKAFFKVLCQYQTRLQLWEQYSMILNLRQPKESCAHTAELLQLYNSEDIRHVQASCKSCWQSCPTHWPLGSWIFNFTPHTASLSTLSA